MDERSTTDEARDAPDASTDAADADFETADAPPQEEELAAVDGLTPGVVEASRSSPWHTGWHAGRALAGRVRRPILRIVSLSWVPLTASLLSLILSVAAIIVSTQQPEVMLILPDQIRVAQGRSSGSAFVYLQPAFVSTGQNERVEVIRDMTLEVQPPNSGPIVSFRWDEQTRLVGDAETGTLSYEYVADAVPLLVSPRSASAPLCLYDAPEGWFFAAGTYSVALLAHRVVVADPVRATFQLSLTANDIAFLDGPGSEQFLAIPIR